MPRDLFTRLQDLSGAGASAGEAKTSSQRGSARYADLHPFSQILGLRNIDSCVTVEDAAFPPEERCSREKFKYRFRACNELTLGLFSLKASINEHPATKSGEEVLLAHIIATKSTNATVTDDDMALPDAEHPDPQQGHKDEGRTICIHSLAVLPEYQGKGLGTVLLKAYLERVRSSGVADTVAIIAHDHLVGYYEKFGFVSRGPSRAQYGGGGWIDMVLTL